MIHGFLLVYDISCVIAGKHLLHRDLDYQPATFHAITSTMSEHMLVASHYTEDGIHIYTAQGDHVGTLDLGLQKDVFIQGIQCNNDGLLHVVVGGNYTATDLYAYRVSPNIRSFISPLIWLLSLCFTSRLVS